MANARVVVVKDTKKDMGVRVLSLVALVGTGWYLGASWGLSHAYPPCTCTPPVTVAALEHEAREYLRKDWQDEAPWRVHCELGSRTRVNCTASSARDPELMVVLCCVPGLGCM